MLHVVNEDLPRRLEHLNHDVVVDVRHKVHHLMVTQVELVEVLLHSRDLFKLMTVLLVLPPGLGKLVFDSLQSQEEVEYLLVALHNILGENGRKGWEVVDSIIKHENLPTFVSRRALQQLDVESLQELWIVILRIT